MLAESNAMNVGIVSVTWADLSKPVVKLERPDPAPKGVLIGSCGTTEVVPFPKPAGDEGFRSL